MANNKQQRSSRVGAFLAAASLPRTFQRSLLPRNTVDQGLASGIVMALVYAIGVVTQDAIDTGSNFVINKTKSSEDPKTQADYSMWASIGAIGICLGLQNIFKKTDDEKLKRASVRTIGYWLAAAGMAGAAVGTVERVSNKLQDDSDDNTNTENTLPPLVVPLLGALIAIVSEASRPKIVERESLANENNDVRFVKALGMSLSVAAIIGVMSAIEEKVAGTIDQAVEKYAPAAKKSWLPIGHVAALGSLAGGLTWYMRRTYRKIESGAERFESVIAKVPESPLLSGSFASFIPWLTMSVEGRRHISDTRTVSDIQDVMGEPAIDPIRLYVGFDSAPTELERAELALAELIRSGAYDREYLVVISPTGTGYVNYIFSESVEYLTRGNCASVTIQYSKRPSPLSLDQVPEGRHHFRMLLNGIRRELKNRPLEKRPKIVIFGESLGAWTSQDAFMNEGTDGFEALGINYALWIGTPKGSKWKEQALYDNRLNTDKELVGVFNDFGEYQKLSVEAKNNIQYCMITHYNDPVAHFDTSLLLQSPKWLDHDRSKRPTTVPKTTRWRTPTTFIHTLIDMKNALKPVPGQFVATGHDYRGDLANFVQAIFKLPATSEQMARVEAALRRNEKQQAELIAEQKRLASNS